jgi:streptogramin lyase
VPILALLAADLAGVARGQVVTEFPVPTAGSGLQRVAAGSDGALWFTEMQGNRIGRITTDGVVTEFPIPSADGYPVGIAPGPDGNLWFTEPFGNRIGRITKDGAITEFPIPTAFTLPADIVAGPDDNLWFTEGAGNRIGRITRTGVVTEFPVPTPSSFPTGIVAGTDGNLWFTENSANKIGRISTSGVVTGEFPVPTADSGPAIIAADRDGNLWFTEEYGGKVGRITSAGVVTEFATPATGGLLGSNPFGITAGPDGNMWFTETGANRIGRITAAGAISEFPIATANSGPGGIAAGSDGNLWFTELAANQIGQITTTAPGPCVADSATLCLNGDRFELRVAWSVPPEGRSGVGTAIPLTGDTGYFWFFNGDNIELVIKVLDGQAINHHFWVFYGALSNVQYTITVRDAVTGVVETYQNPYGTLASVADTSAFSPNGAALETPEAAPAQDLEMRSSEELHGLYAALTGTVAPKIAPAGCTPGGTTLCLNQSRFQLTVDWEAPNQGTSGHGRAVPITGDTGYFWFFNGDNVELVIKVLDGRANNGHFWVFYGALSDVQYTITVTDTETQLFKTYTNPSGTLASVADTEAF